MNMAFVSLIFRTLMTSHDLRYRWQELGMEVALPSAFLPCSVPPDLISADYLVYDAVLRNVLWKDDLPGLG